MGFSRRRISTATHTGTNEVLDETAREHPHCAEVEGSPSELHTGPSPLTTKADRCGIAIDLDPGAA